MNCRPAGVALSVVVLFLLVLVPAGLVSAQERPGQPGILTYPQVNYPLQFDVSRPLHDMATHVI